MKRSNATTERLLTTAGLAPGMSVLELGCGPGEVTQLISKLVGASGQVLAVDCSDEMLTLAQHNIEQAGVDNVLFLKADLNDSPSYLQEIEHATFDAIVGRRVLMYLSHPEQVLNALLPRLRDQGLVVFEEMDTSLGAVHIADMPAHAQATELFSAMLSKEGVAPAIGFRLPDLMTSAGLQFERIWAEAVIEGQGDQYTLGELLHLVKPRLLAAGIATDGQIETLIRQIGNEQSPTNVFLSGMRFCALATKLPASLATTR